MFLIGKSPGLGMADSYPERHSATLSLHNVLERDYPCLAGRPLKSVSSTRVVDCPRPRFQHDPANHPRPSAAIRSDLRLLGGCAGNVLAQRLGVLIELLRRALLKRKFPGCVVLPSQPLVSCGERKVNGRILG